MFETAEVGRRASKKEFETEEPKLRLELLEAQRALETAWKTLEMRRAQVAGHRRLLASLLSLSR